MDLRHSYIIIMLDNIFKYGSDVIDIPDKTGHVEFIEDVLRLFPIHKEIKKIMDDLYMKTIDLDLDGDKIIIYGGGNKYESNWYYTFFDVDNILDFINGNFSFQMALEGEDGDDDQDTFKTLVDVSNYKVKNMYIDKDDEDIWIIKNGQEKIE